MKDCIFCKISVGEIPNHTVYEDSHVLAFLDIHPRAKGHTVIIPKMHAETILDLNDELLGPFMLGVKRTIERLERVLGSDGYSIGLNHGESAGQMVSHLHAHIMPRWVGDGGGNVHSIIDNPTSESVESVAARFV